MPQSTRLSKKLATVVSISQKTVSKNSLSSNAWSCPYVNVARILQKSWQNYTQLHRWQILKQPPVSQYRNLIEATDRHAGIILVSDSDVCGCQTVTFPIYGFSISLLAYLLYRSNAQKQVLLIISPSTFV